MYDTMQSLRTPQPDLAVRSTADQPWLLGMPSDVQHSQTLCYSVSAQNLERDDERVLHQVGVDRCVEDLNRAVVTGRGEEGKCGVESNAAERAGVVSGCQLPRPQTIYRRLSSPQGLVWLGRQVQVEPAELLVVTSDQHVVSSRMNIQTTDPLHSRLQRLDQRLTCQVVQSDVSLRRSEEPRLERVERHALHGTASLLEWRLRSVSGELMDEDGFVRGYHEHHS